MDSAKTQNKGNVISSSPEILSPGGKSRYGRTRRPKIARDFYNIDDVVIEENPPNHQVSPIKSPKVKSNAKSPIIGREIVFDIKDEFTKLDDLGMKVANNFKTNLQRGLDDTIKERKFFKSMPENKLEVPNVVDVTKVFKLISAKPAVVADVYEKKTPPKSMVKTYSNKRKHLYDSESCVVESFGLPDEPIIPVSSPITQLERNIKIDIDVNSEANVNLSNPWTFNEFQPSQVFINDPVSTDMNRVFEANITKSTVLDLFSCESFLSENTYFDNRLGITSNTEQKSEFGIYQKTKKNSRSDQIANLEVKKREEVGTALKDVHLKTKYNQDMATREKIGRSEGVSSVDQVVETVKKNMQKTINKTVGHNVEIEGKKNKKHLLKNIPSSSVVKKSKAQELSPNKRTLRSNTDSADIANFTSSEGESPSINQRTLRSKSTTSPSLDKPKIKIKEQVINPVKLSKIICDSQVRVILNPLACIKHLQQGYVNNETLLPNPYQIKTLKSVKLSEKLSSSKNHDDNSENMKVKKKGRQRKLKALDANAQVENLDVKNIKIEIIEYQVGDLAWAKIGTHPYWPCLITEEPISGQYRKNVANRSQPLYHVRFFGDNGRRSWVNANRVMLYYGRDDLEKIAKKLKVEDKVKASFIKESYVIKTSKLAKWEAGVAEAESLKSKSLEQRLSYFFEVFASKREKKQLNDLIVKQELYENEEPPDTEFNKNKKRERMSEGDSQSKVKAKKSKLENDSPKKPKTVEVKEEITEEIVQDSRKKVKKLSKSLEEVKDSSPCETSRKLKMSSSNDDIREDPSEAHKKVKKSAKGVEGDIQEETPKKPQRKSQSNEDLPDDQASPKKNNKNEEILDQNARKRLRNSKEDSEESRRKLKSKEETSEETQEVRKKMKRNSTEDQPQETEECEENALLKPKNKRHLINCEYSNSDTDSKFSDNSSVPASLESQAALYRRNNIFRGIPKEKVCQICEQPGEVFKCKGPCNGVYHYNCAMSIQTKDVSNVENKSETEVAESKNNVEIIAVTSKKEKPLPNLSALPNFKGMTLAEKIDFRMKEIMKKFDYQSVYESTDSSSEEFILDESFEKPENRSNKTKNQSKLSLTVTSKPTKKEVPIIKHVTADNINYICVTNETAKDKEVTELLKNTLKHLRCNWCSSGEISRCLVCNKEESKFGSKFRQKCSLHQCGKYYHPECLKAWPQTQWSLIHSTKDKKSDASYDTFVCPRHVCHTCISDNPRAANSRCPSDKVVKCLRCPATYHSSNYCVPAGTHILSSSQIVCPRHYSKQKSAKKRNFQQTINTNWCFICSKGGDLICCETCPTSVHAECLPGDLNEDDTFFCEDCQSGRLPLYDEIVWVKLGTFRWWPALILFPNEVPDNVRNINHNKGEFVVKFFGTYDHYWVGRGRTFLFQEGDKGHSNPIRKRVDNAFVKAIEEAAAAHQLKKQFKVSKVAEKNTGLKPPPYIRIKVNKPVGNVRQFDGNTSNTTSCDCDPNQPHPCGPDSDCLNRLLLTECNPEVCPAGDRCNNQCFEKREYPPLVPHRTQVRGWGLKTLAPIRKGQFVIEYVGEMIDEQEYQRRIQKMHEQKEENYYFLTIDKDRMLDAGPKGNVARFMNHSCQPNCETQKWTVNGDTRVGLFAKYDIPADTELTFNYNLECIGKEKKICKCGAPNCSGFIGVKVKSDGPQKKLSKPKKKKSPVPVSEVSKENPCFICGKMGEVGACNNKICTKYYHLECVGMSKWPEGGKWVCQWHNCNICTKRTLRCCVKCINSFCPSHSEGNVRYDKLLGFVCTEHDPTKESNEVEVRNVPKFNIDESTDEGAVTSTTSEEAVSTTKKSEVEPDDDFLDSMSLKMRLNGWMTSTPLKKDNLKEESSLDENTVSSASMPESKSKVKKGKRKRKIKKKSNAKKLVVNKIEVKNTANLFISTQNEVKLSNFTPVKYLRTSRNSSKVLNRTDPDKDLPIRKRTRLRCGNTL